MDKEFLLKLVDVIENLYVENKVYKSLFKVYRRQFPPQREIDELMARAKSDPLVGGRAHEEFEPLRDRIRANETLEQVLREFLKVVPATKDVN